MNLFQQGDFTLASGQHSTWKIDCDALTSGDWWTLAHMLAERLDKPFGSVVGVPRGGLPFAEALQDHITHDSETVLVVDDVWTTGNSMDELIACLPGSPCYISFPYQRAVVFARGPLPDNVIALFWTQP